MTPFIIVTKLANSISCRLYASRRADNEMINALLLNIDNAFKNSIRFSLYKFIKFQLDKNLITSNWSFLSGADGHF